MRPVPVGVEPRIEAFLSEIRSAVMQLQNPGKPSQCFAVTQAKLPPAENYQNCQVLVEDLNTLAVSTDVAGTWTWLRADGGAL